MELGAVNEAAESLTTRIVPDTNVGDFENTSWNMVANLTGATLAGYLIWVSGVIDQPLGQSLHRSSTEPNVTAGLGKWG